MEIRLVYIFSVFNGYFVRFCIKSGKWKGKLKSSGKAVKPSCSGWAYWWILGPVIVDRSKNTCTYRQALQADIKLFYFHKTMLDSRQNCISWSRSANDKYLTWDNLFYTDLLGIFLKQRKKNHRNYNILVLTKIPLGRDVKRKNLDKLMTLRYAQQNHVGFWHAAFCQTLLLT